MSSPRILVTDIETMFNVVAAFSLKVDGYINHDAILEERYIVSASWKWLDRPRIYSTSILDGKGPDEYPDMPVMKAFSEAIGEADAVIAHNGDSFDIPWMRTRMVMAEMKPPPPVTQIDTRKICKAHFLFNSNSLDYVAQRLKVGRKIETRFSMWKEMYRGDRSAIRECVRYNRHDVHPLLEGVYLKLRSFVPAKVNRALWSDDKRTCPTCGEAALEGRGYGQNRVTTYRRMQCRKCGAWSSQPMSSKAVVR